ncbi:hypothetical protein J4G33_13505 [Actinotalea sp. BY-33]|uniref:PH domain-containing protein n=1 Tax=Actinotalea soli TaxID=2819234 RepID=A0A939LVD9_9CELL|nr:hypothetical protein [Actinotalea soli]MBO1752824.1 hypothetical protein [Actinotalea soli]
MERVIGQSGFSRRVAWVLVGCALAQVVLQGVALAMGSGSRFSLPLLLCGVVLVAIWLGQVVASRTMLTITSDELAVRVGLRTVEILREQVTDVEGNVPGRPTWSEHVVVHHAGRTTALPALETLPAELIPLLRDWAGLDEPSDQASSSGGSTSTG